MKTDKNIFIAFLLNLTFSVFELCGGIYIGSIAILADAIHDIGDAASLGFSFLLEKKSQKQPDESYTYGYARYSVIGSIITTFILLAGSVLVLCNAASRIIAPVKINYNGMLLFAIIGICVNSLAAFFTHGKHSMNQKAVHLHMMEDVLGWGVVLIGAILMKYTDIVLLDPFMSIGVAVFILIHAVKNIKDALDILLEKVPTGTDIHEIKEQITKIPGVLDVHHIHLWSMDGQTNYATMHVLTKKDAPKIKDKIRNVLHVHAIDHVTLETETEEEHCFEQLCSIKPIQSKCHHHH